MRISHFVMHVAACALLMTAPALARDGGGHRGGGSGYHGGGHHSGGYGHRGSGFRGGGYGYRGGGFRHGGFRGGGFGYGGFGYPSYFGGPIISYGFGYPYYGGFYDPFYYPRRTTTIIREAPQEGAPAFATAQGEPPKQNWYFCADSGQYYPYVKTCASAWQEVPAVPPPPNPEVK